MTGIESPLFMGGLALLSAALLWALLAVVRSRRQWRREAVEREREIGEARRHLETVRKEAALMRAVFARLPMPAWHLDAEGRLCMESAAAKGIEKIQIGMKIGEVALSERTLQRWTRYLREGSGREVSRTEVSLERADGVRHCLESALSLRDEAGVFSGLVIVYEDITEQKAAESTRRHLERQIREKQKHEAIGVLAGGAAHDLNNLMSVIVCNAELAHDGSAESPWLKPYLRGIVDTSHKAQELIGRILAYSRKRAPEMRTVDLKEVVAESLGLIRHLMPETVKVAFDGGGALPPVRADAMGVHQVVMNLCTNAAHAMQARGGRLEVALARVHGGEARMRDLLDLAGREYVELRVTDTGCGIPERHLGSIFEPFFTTKDPGEGTGLGLAVVQGIVREHHGAVRCRSEEGRGTTFWVYFPVAEREVEMWEVEEQDSAGGRSERAVRDSSEP